jgi:hypothetical protein
LPYHPITRYGSFQISLDPNQVETKSDSPDFPHNPALGNWGEAVREGSR